MEHLRQGFGKDVTAKYRFGRHRTHRNIGGKKMSEIYTISCEGLTAKICSFGAELHSLMKDGCEYIWQAGKAWSRHAPILFPFICSPEGKSYSAKGRAYTMKANHGFARDMEFKPLLTAGDRVSLSLTETDETLAQYPYRFKLTVSYYFESGRLVTSCCVENTDTDDMYFYLGGHPAFNCPLEESLCFDDYFVEYEKDELIEQKAGDGMRTVLGGSGNGRRLWLTRKLFDYDVIMKDMPASSSVSLRSEKGNRYVTLFFPDSDCIAVWSPAADDSAAFVCLEPWTSVPVYCDDGYERLEEKPHAVALRAGEKFCYRYSIEVG